MKEKEEELNIDFSGLFSFFKKKKKEQNKVENNLQEKEEEKTSSKNEEISFDIKKVKGIFSKIKKGVLETPKNEDPDSIDFSKIKKFVIKNHTLLILLLLITIQLVPNAGFWPWGGIWMRMQTQNLPQIDNWAENSVNNFYKTQISNQINKQYPNLPANNKNKLIEKEFNTFLKETPSQINSQIKNTAEQFRERFQYEKDGKKYTYMPDIDPYTYLRFARNKIKTGKFEDTIKDGVYWDDHSLAPLGRDLNINFHHHFLVLVYSIFSIFLPKIPLMQSATYFPIIMLLLSLIPVFFIGKKLAGNTGGFFAASMLILNAAGTGRTTWGHADTDAYNIFFPVLIVWLFIESLCAKTYKKKILFSFLTALSLGLFSSAWSGGWWYLFYFLMASILINFIYIIFFYRKIIIKDFTQTFKIKEVKNIFFVVFFFFVFSGIFISLIHKPTTFLYSILGPLKFTIIKSAAHVNLWPNVYTTVAELNPASITSIINNMGGKFLFVICILGILLTFTIKDSSGNRDIKYAALLSIWFIATIYASTKGIRFTLLMVPAFSIAFGVAAGLIYRFVSNWMKKNLNISKWISGTVIIIIFALLLVSPTKSSYESVKNDFPIINDAWWSALTKIKEESAPDAIINSWWDFGHHFKYIADRAVTFDGATQNYPHAHWIGNVLLTGNENQAIGILRMLDCGSNRAFETLDKEIKDTVKSLDILYKIIEVDKSKAKNILKEYIENPEEVIQYTHCSPPENYFITSADMIKKAGVWAHFGGWNFERADIWMNLKKLPKEQAVSEMTKKYNYTKETAENLYFEVQALNDEKEANGWISPWPGYASNLIGCQENNNVIKCGENVFVKYNESSKDYEVLLKVQNNAGIPDSLVYIDPISKEFVEKKFNSSNVGLSVVLIPKGDSYESILCSPEIATSMFTRLFFLEGHGLKHFDLFDNQRQVTGGDIYVWTVDWDGHEPNIHPDLIEKQIASEGDTVKINYIGWTDDEVVFDSSIIDWNQKNISKESGFSGYKTRPLSFEVGSGQVVKGFDDGVKGMKKDETKIIKISPEDAYGTDPDAHPLGNQTLNFKIRIVEID